MSATHKAGFRYFEAKESGIPVRFFVPHFNMTMNNFIYSPLITNVVPKKLVVKVLQIIKLL
jgi:hypothetical protein